MSPAVIAVIDDDALLRAAIASLIRSYDYQTAVFASATEFLATSRDAVSCIVSDLQMPDLTGLDLARRLRAAEDPPLILMTAHATPSTHQEAEAAGVRAVLEKPLAPEVLIAAIQNAISDRA
ncbi:MAG: response regulator [Proteobacteria bacterium]|nr:response regulator [Pseudomonadota bacterium]